MSMNFANPKADFVFKRLFGSDGHKTLTISLLNNILGRTEYNEIKEIKFCNIENIPVADGEKESYLDILCTDKLQHTFIIEMSPFAKASQDGHVQGFYNKITLKHKTYQLNNSLDTHYMSAKALATVDVELCNFHKDLEELQTNMDKWLYFLKNAESLSIIPDQFKNSPEFTEAFEVVEQSLWTSKERRAYRKSLDALHKNMRLQAGIFEEGLEEGQQRGEQKKAEAIAINMLKKI